MVDWALGVTGQAVATWVSALLSFFAIVIALLVALYEQRRANADRVREAERERADLARRARELAERKASFVSLCATLITEAADTLEAEIKSIPAESYIDWSRSRGIPKTLGPMLAPLQALQSVWQGDAQVVLTLSRAVQALDDLVNAYPDTAPSSARAKAYATPRLNELRNMQEQMLKYLPPD